MLRHCYLFFFVFSTHAFSQSSTFQGWLEAMGTHSISNTIGLEHCFTYSTLYGTPKWRAYDYSLCMERNMSKHWDLMAQGVLSYTVQTENYNTLELRPILGCRWHITKASSHRLYLRMLLRMEQRNLKNLSNDTWEVSVRPRIRFELLFPISSSRMTDTNLWYGIWDIEFLYYDDRVTERFANKNRMRLGIGYTPDKRWKFETIVMWQQSRNTIESSFEQSDIILRLRLRYFLPQKEKDTLNEGVGN